jgi:hypothetical protein
VRRGIDIVHGSDAEIAGGTNADFPDTRLMMDTVESAMELVHQRPQRCRFISQQPDNELNGRNEYGQVL